MSEAVSQETYNGRVTLCDERFQDINKRQNKLEDAFELSTKLDVKLGLLVDQLREERTKDNDRITVLEQKPGKRWDAFVMGAILALLGGIVGYFIK